MTIPTLILALAALTATTIVTLYLVNQATVRIEIRDRQDRATQRAWITAMGALETVIASQQAHVERIIGVTEQPVDEVAIDPAAEYEAALTELDDFHARVGDDEPDWTDAFVPREATGRVAGIRPGQSPIPGVAESVVDGEAQPNYGTEEYVWNDENA